MRRVELVHIHTASYASFWRKTLFFIAARLFGIPCIVHLHGGTFHLFYQSMGAVGRAIVRYVFDHAATIIVLSNSWAKWIASISKNPNVLVVPNPIKVPEPQPGRSNGRESILYLGLVSHEKGAYDLIDAVQIVRRSCPFVQLQIAGNGDLDRAARRIEQSGCRDYVSLLGWVSGPDKTTLLDSAAVLCLPSYNEGLPMSLLEAMASGLPVVTTPVGGIPEAVADGVEGFLVQPGDITSLADRLAVLLSNPDTAAAMGARGREKCLTTYSVDKVIPTIQRLYEELGARPREVSRIDQTKQHPSVS
jgi:glycosyltransferase involved in cell wall biosynthesis